MHGSSGSGSSTSSSSTSSRRRARLQRQQQEERRRLAVLGLHSELSEHRGSRCRRKVPTFLGLWRAGVAVQLVAAQSMGRGKESIRSSPDPTVTVTPTALRASTQPPVCDCEGCEETTTTTTAASDWYEKPADWAESPALWPENTVVVAAPEKAADGCSSSFGGPSAVDCGCEEERLSVWPVDADKKNYSGGGNDCGDDTGGV
ncbi:unnamed protein product, partial [Ectocarpus sp. 12 AP-2014]